MTILSIARRAATATLTAFGLLAIPGFSGLAKAACAQNGTGCWMDHGGANVLGLAVGPGFGCGIVTHSDTSYGNGLRCFKPLGTAWLNEVFYPFNTSTIFKDSTGFRINSLAVLENGTTGLGQKGPLTLLALRADGTLWKSTLDSRFRDHNDNPTDWVELARAADAQGVGVIPRGVAAISQVLPFGYEHSIVGGLDYPNCKLWQPVPNQAWGPVPGYPGSYRLIFGGASQGAIVLVGASTTSKTLGIIKNNSVRQPPPIPANVTLAKVDKGFWDHGLVQNIAMGENDIWLMTSSSDITTRVMRSTADAWGIWSAWAAYNMGTLADYQAADPGTDDPLPWSFVDASVFRGRRGELMFVGDYYRLMSYIPN